MQLIQESECTFLEQAAPATLPSHQITILRIAGSLHFASIYTLEQKFPAIEGEGAAVLLAVREHDNAELGVTSTRSLERLTRRLHEAKGQLFLVGVSHNFYQKLEDAGLVDLIGKDYIFLATPVLGGALKAAIHSAEQWLAAGAMLSSLIRNAGDRQAGKH